DRARIRARGQLDPAERIVADLPVERGEALGERRLGVMLGVTADRRAEAALGGEPQRVARVDEAARIRPGPEFRVLEGDSGLRRRRR
ncbi:MAG: hypothetical protein ACK4N5_26570, partial [Myxococcales bacterium]